MEIDLVICLRANDEVEIKQFKPVPHGRDTIAPIARPQPFA
jgi:hypothetical protein